MFRSLLSHSPYRVGARVALGGALASLLALPALAQGNRPVVRHAHPTIRLDRRHTRVTMEFNLPSRFTLVERPWIRIIEADGRPLLNTRIIFTERGGTWRGYRDLNTEDFPSGAYRLRVEATFNTPDGKRETITSAWAAFVVPKR
jgi:hypothetical protein